MEPDVRGRERLTGRAPGGQTRERGRRGVREKEGEGARARERERMAGGSKPC